jgi:site-specific recombinase
MSWDLHHTNSERLAQAAQAALAASDQKRAHDLYRQAAESEERALAELDLAKSRTRGVTAVSALSLWLKSAQIETVRQRGEELLRDESLPRFAVTQIREILHSAKNTRAPRRYEVEITFRQTLRYEVNARDRRAAEREALSLWKVGDDTHVLGSDVCEVLDVQAHTHS